MIKVNDKEVEAIAERLVTCEYSLLEDGLSQATDDINKLLFKIDAAFEAGYEAAKENVNDWLEAPER